MSASPGVSVVVPAYNYAHFVGQTMESVLAQDYPNFEVLVVDDGSTDDTAAVVARYTDPRVICIRKQNAGLSAARNTGIQHARCPFVAFLDADDLWHPTFLSNAMALFAKLHDEYAVVACGTRLIDTEGNSITRAAIGEMGDWEAEAGDILLKTRFAPSSVVAKKDVLESLGGFDTMLTSSEDRDMWLRIAATRRIYISGKKLLLLRQHGGSMRRNAARMSVNSSKMLRSAYKTNLVPHRRLLLWLKAFAFNHYESACRYSNEHNQGQACRHLLVSFLLCPFFPRPVRLNVPPLFRLRALVRLVWRNG